MTALDFTPRPDPGPTRPAHCQECGRFARVIYVPTGPDITGDWPDAIGKCRAHGEVNICWEPA